MIVFVSLLLAVLQTPQQPVPVPPTPIPLLPSVSPTPDTCNVAAAVVVPAMPHYPKAAADVRVKLTIDVDVQLDEQGNVTGTEIEHSSGRDDIDQAAVDAAKATVYAPQRADCKPLASTYHQHFVFKPPA